MMSDQASNQPPVPDDDKPSLDPGGAFSAGLPTEPEIEPDIEPAHGFTDEPEVEADIEPELGSDDEPEAKPEIPAYAYEFDVDFPAVGKAPVRPAPPAPVRTRRRPVEPILNASVPPSGRGYACADVITALFLLLTVLVLSATILLIANPHSALNPFPPATFPALMVIASPYPTETATSTSTPEPFTPTPLPSPTALPSATFTPTDTPTLTPTPVVGLASGGSATSNGGPTATEVAPTALLYTPSAFPFTAKPIRYQANTTDQACQWQSIAGSVTDLSGKPIKGLAIHIFGSNGNIDEVHYTGTEQRFGDSGFEVFLGATPREDSYTIQLLGRTGAPISDTVNIQTHQGCDQNVAVVNFVQNHPY